MDRYEEALERAKKGLPIDEVFPELKESEDERIIDDAIQIIRASRLRCAEYGSEADKHLKAIAWLEKQKEQKPESCDCSRDEESYTNGIHHVLMNPEAYGLIKQQPAEWSEEDNINLNACIQIINDAWEKAQIKELSTTKFAPHYYGDLIDWLKSLQHYYGDLIDWLKSLQPNWKPSKDQMKALEDAFRKDGGNEYRKIINSLYNDLQKLL